MADARFAAFRNLAAGSSANAGQAISLREELTRCGAVYEEAVQLITAAMVQRLASLMMIPEADIDAGKPLSACGIDSLVAVEVRNWIARARWRSSAPCLT
jgi:hypothetical protein